MANPYNNASTYGGDRFSSAFPTRPNAATDRYSDASLLASSKYLTSDPAATKASYFSIQADGNIASAAVTFPSKFAGEIGAPAVDLSGAKRPAEALYHQPILGTQNAMGQSEALFSAHTFAKYPRFETASNLHKYPQRPGEKDCSHYMLTRTCNFGANCKFDHPLWVPEGGISGWKEIPVIDDTCEPPPERPGEPDCLYYMKTQRCKFGYRCKFNHPKVTTDASAGGVVGEGLQTLSAGQNSVSMDNEVAGGDTNPTKLLVPFTHAFLHNSKGLPVRPGETDCPFYLKTGSCKYGAVCRYNHPDRNLISPQVPAALGQVMIPPPATNLPLGIINPAANLLPSMDPRLTQAQIAVAQTIYPAQNIYPQRPGELECDHYMKFGQCKFGERCKFHHPIDRFAPISQEQNIKLTLAGLPRRECTVACPYYMKTGACNYGVKCRFDHPPPGEAVAMAAVQGNASPEEEEEEEDTADDSRGIA